MEIQPCQDDDAIRACYPVMRQLRPHIPDAEAFLATVRRIEQEGYRLVAGSVGDRIVAVAGYRPMETLFRGKTLYVDDLVTDAAQRSQGHGAALLEWLRQRAREEGCTQLVLDSGLQRTEAHRFYRREGMTEQAYNFRQDLPDRP